MSTVYLQQFNNAKESSLEKAVKVLEAETRRFVLGSNVQQPGALQITLETDGIGETQTSAAATEISTAVGDPSQSFHVTFDRLLFGPNGPATANILEWVKVDFPVSRDTAEFRRKIEDDFEQFDEIFVGGVSGTSGRAFGWGVEEHTKKETMSFFVVRGWENMHYFEQSLQTAEYKKASPILFAWNAPFKLWHVERKY